MLESWRGPFPPPTTIGQTGEANSAKTDNALRLLIFQIFPVTVLRPHLSWTVLSSVKRRNCSCLGNCECQKVMDVWRQQCYRFTVWKGLLLFLPHPPSSLTFCQASRLHCVQLHRRQKRQTSFVCIMWRDVPSDVCQVLTLPVRDLC